LNPELIERGYSPARLAASGGQAGHMKNLGSSFDRRARGRYYSSASKMETSYLDNYGPLLLMFVLSAGLASLLIAASTIVGKHKRTREKDEPYECGIRPTGDAREPFSVHFYMVALLFILFDIEAIFLYPWALIYHDLKVFGFVEMLLYVMILLVGYILLWKKGALDWR
jgi:NADH-quinone oxidoreductase subunit A